MRTRSTLTFLHGLLVCSLLASSAAAQSPYQFDVDSFSVPERGISDDFNDGSLSPAWNGTVFGTAVESGGTLTLSNPGAFGFLPAPLINEASVVSGQGIGIDFLGDFTATSTWLQTVPTSGAGLNMALGSIDPTTGNVHQLSVGVSFATSGTAAVLGGDAGLSVSVLEVVRDSAPGNILSLSRSTFPILAGDIQGDILLQLIFDDAANTLRPQVSLDGGSTTLAPFAAIPWEFAGGGFSLSASSTVPEPGTALLLGMGLIVMGAARPRRD